MNNYNRNSRWFYSKRNSSWIVRAPRTRKYFQQNHRRKPFQPKEINAYKTYTLSPVFCWWHLHLLFLLFSLGFSPSGFSHFVFSLLQLFPVSGLRQFTYFFDPFNCTFLCFFQEFACFVLKALHLFVFSCIFQGIYTLIL